MNKVNYHQFCTCNLVRGVSKAYSTVLYFYTIKCDRSYRLFLEASSCRNIYQQCPQTLMEAPVIPQTR